MSVKDTANQYAALNPVVPNTVSRSLGAGDRSFSDVVFESGKPVLDCELNLQQDAKAFASALVSKQAQQSGFYRGQGRHDALTDYFFDTPPTLPVNSFGLKRLEAVVAGFPLVLEYTNTANAGENVVVLNAPTAYDALDPTTIKRTDFVFLEVWQALVAPSPQAKITVTLAGVGGGDTLTLNPGAVVLTAGVDFVVGANDTITAINLAAAVNLVPNFQATSTGPYVTIWATGTAVTGAAGNACTVVGTGGISPLAVTNFAGGADRPYKPSQDQLYRHGNVLSDTATWLPDDLMDPSLHAETTQRVQVQYRIRVTGATEAVDYKVNPDGFSNTAVRAQGGSGAPVANYPFVPADGVTAKGNSSAPAYGAVDNGLWIAGQGDAASAIDLNSLDGYVYAIPICMVFRHNQSEGAGLGFDPKNNTNGAPSWGHAFYQNTLIDPFGLPLDVLANLSDRPDGHFADVIFLENLLDLRRHVNPMGVDLKAELQYQIQSLMDGKNRTWAIDTADKQQMGNGSGDVSTQPLICDAIGRTDAVDGTNELQGNTPRGTTVRNFDHICRRFADQPVTERVVVAFYPHDSQAGAGLDGEYVDAPVVILNSAAASNPILFTTAAAHGYAVGDYVEVVSHSITAVNRKWVISSTPAPNTFTVSYDNSAGPAGAGGNAYGVGVTNPGKYVVKAAGSEPYRWYEDDQLVFDLTLFDVTTDGGIFDGRTWVSSAAGAPPPAGVYFPAYAPAGTVISNVLSVYHDDGYFFGGPGIDQRVQVKSVVGLGTLTVALTLDANGLTANSGLLTNNVVGDPAYNPTHLLVRPSGDIDPINGSERRIFVEFEVTYPRGEYGTSNTPTLLAEPNSPAAAPPPDGVYPFGLTAQRNRALVENYSPARPLDWHNLTGVLYREGHREAQLEYQVGAPLTAPFPTPIISNTRLFDDLVSRTATTLYFPRRVFDERGGVQVTDLSTGLAVTVDEALTPFGSSTRQVILDVGTPLAQNQTRCDIEYYALDAIPNYGPTTGAYQLSFYYRTNAPQTVGIHNGDFINTLAGGQVPPILPVEPLVTSEMLLTGQVGMGSTEDGFPYAAPLDQIPIYDGMPFVAASVGIAPVATPGISVSNPVVITTVANHGYSIGTYVQISGASVLGVNGYWVVTSTPALDTFTIAYDNSAGAAGGGGTCLTVPSTPTAREWAIAGTANISIADFNANTGLLNLPTYVAQDGTQILQLGGLNTSPVIERPVVDSEFRILYPFTDVAGYHPTIMSEPLMGPVGHKVFVPFLARALYDEGPYAARNANPAEDGLLYRKNEILLVVLTRYAILDANNEIVFTNVPSSRVSAAVYRTRNLLLTVGE